MTPVFMHYREETPSGDINPLGGATLAIQYYNSNKSSILVAMSVCNKNDNFNKATGRDIALSRLLTFINGEPVKFVYIFPRIKGYSLRRNAAHFLEEFL